MVFETMICKNVPLIRIMNKIICRILLSLRKLPLQKQSKWHLPFIGTQDKGKKFYFGFDKNIITKYDYRETQSGSWYTCQQKQTPL